MTTKKKGQKMSGKRRSDTIGEKYGCYTIIRMVYGEGTMSCIAKCEVCGREKKFQYYNLKYRQNTGCICDREKYITKSKRKETDAIEYTPPQSDKVYTCIVCGRVIEQNKGLRKFCRKCFDEINRGVRVDVPSKAAFGVAKKLSNMEVDYDFLGM